MVEGGGGEVGDRRRRREGMNDEKKDDTQGMRLMLADDDADDDESNVQQEVRADSRSARAGHWASQKTKLNNIQITRRKTQKAQGHHKPVRTISDEWEQSEDADKGRGLGCWIVGLLRAHQSHVTCYSPHNT